MLLTRKACYGLIVVKHLAENMGKGTFSASDLAALYGFPQEALAKILQHLTSAGVLVSHHGINGGYRLARSPQQITVLDVINASEGQTPLIHEKHLRQLELLPGYNQLRTVSKIVEDALRRVTIAGMRRAAKSSRGIGDRERRL
jgi:Rrf2 family protein